MATGPEHYTMAEELLDRAKAHVLNVLDGMHCPEFVFDVDAMMIAKALNDSATVHAQLAAIALEVDRNAGPQQPNDWRKATRNPR